MTKRERELIEEIANYIIPSFRFSREGETVEMVPLEKVIYLRCLAREALKPAKAKK